jgi:hypothetical protein
MNPHQKLTATAGIAVLAISLGACNSPKNNSQAQGQKITEQYAQRLTSARPYPLSKMNDSDERANLAERLLRFNDPNKIGYLYELTQNGQILGYYTVKGKVSSASSQMTPTQSIAHCDGNSASCAVVESMGDDGSFGPNEQGIFFFTTSGVMVEWNGLWQYSDAPLHLSQKPLITLDLGAKPSSTAGQIK